MSSEKGAYRWWENYLVRYFMPSIAGAIIVNWLIAAGHPDLKNHLLLQLDERQIQTPTLVLLFLYGNLFCYISSYPILGFHVTRVIDFKEGIWNRKFWDGYVSTFLLSSIVFCLSLCSGGTSFINRALPFTVVIVFVGIQLYRIYCASVNIKFGNLESPTSKLYKYTFKLAQRRAVMADDQKTMHLFKNQKEVTGQDKFDEEAISDERKREIIDTYRHMREHGNSAFIFVLELTLAGLCYLILIAFSSYDAIQQLSLIGILFGVWAIPAVFIHRVGQQIERRFSLYDQKIARNKISSYDCCDSEH